MSAHRVLAIHLPEYGPIVELQDRDFMITSISTK